MRYHVVAVGRMRDAALRAVCDGYLERLRRYTKVEEREVKVEARLLEAVPEGSRLVALAEQGDQWTSAQLADWTARCELEARDVTFAWARRRPPRAGAARGRASLELVHASRFHTSWRASCYTSSCTGPTRSVAGSRIIGDPDLTVADRAALLRLARATLVAPSRGSAACRLSPTSPGPRSREGRSSPSPRPGGALRGCVGHVAKPAARSAR